MTDGEVGGDGVVLRLEQPTATAAAAAIDAAHEEGRVVSLVGACRIDGPDDDGTPAARRLVLLKPDGAVAVHGRDGAMAEVAVRGQCDGTVDVTAEDGALLIHLSGDGAANRLGIEGVDHLETVRLDATANKASAPDVEGRDGSVAATGHAAIRERLLETPEVVEPGFAPLATERETAAGPVDVFGRDAEGRAVVVEIKAARAGPAAVGQLDRYVEALGRDLHAGAEVRGVLVAPSATGRTRDLLEERGYGFRALAPE